MEFNLSNGKTITFDPNEVLPNPQVRSREWLKERMENGIQSKAARDLTDYDPDGLYRFKDSLRELRRSVRGKRGPGPSHTRGYCEEMLKRVNAELDRRGLPRTRSGDRRTYGPGCASWQQAGEAA